MTELILICCAVLLFWALCGIIGERQGIDLAREQWLKANWLDEKKALEEMIGALLSELEEKDG